VDDAPAPYVVETPDHPLLLLVVFLLGTIGYTGVCLNDGGSWLLSMLIGGFAGFITTGLVLMLLMGLRLVYCRRLLAAGDRGPVLVQPMVLGRPWGPLQPLEFNHREVAEIHLHVVPTKTGSEEMLYVAFADGTRQLLYERSMALGRHVAPLNDLRVFAERLAEHTGSTVQVIRSNAAPNMHEIRARLENRSDEARPVTLPVAESTGDGTKKGMRKPTMVPSACPSCRQPLTVPVTQCQRCRTVVHRVCWERHNGCPVAGCGGKTGDEPHSVVPPAEPFVCATQPTAACATFAGLVAGLWFVTSALFLDSAGPLAAAPLVVTLLGVVVAAAGRRRFVFEPAEGRVDAEYLLLRAVLWKTCGWRSAADVAAVHHHWSRTFDDSYEEVYVAWRDGTRTCMYRQPAADQPDRLGGEAVEQLAERLAAFGGCTVRFVRGTKAPPALPAAQD